MEEGEGRVRVWVGGEVGVGRDGRDDGLCKVEVV